MQIKALADATGVEVETIRYYEKRGLLPAPARQANGYRDYGPAHLERLAFVRHCRALDMPLDVVEQLLAYLDDPVAHCAETQTLVDQQLRRVRARLQSLRALERQLRQLQRSCSGTGTDTTAQAGCGILQELVSAAQGEQCACHGAG